MINMTEVLGQVTLKSELESLSTEEKEYARIRILEKELIKRKRRLSLSNESVQKVENKLADEPNEIDDDVPQYLSVAEVAAIMSISPQQVRKNCASRKYQGYQPSGPKGIWFVNSDTFRNDPKVDWADFISRRNKVFSQSQEIAEAAIQLQDQDLKELDVDAAKE